jgi:uncharacterized membrane protein YqgA involved in biofilm formation
MTDWVLWGTAVNTAAVLLGALLGLAIKTLARRIYVRLENRDTENGERLLRLSALPDTVHKALGLCGILIGISGALKTQNVLVMILSMAFGTVVGELLGLDAHLNRFGGFIERKLKGSNGNVAEGFVTATLLFCVGAMTVTGAMESGVLHTHTTYYTKSVLDMSSAVVLASTLGVGVVLSAVAVLGVQTILTLIAMLAAGAIPLAITGEMTAVGSLLVVGIGTNLLGVTKLRLVNMLPAMFFPLALCPLFELIPIF